MLVRISQKSLFKLLMASDERDDLRKERENRFLLLEKQKQYEEELKQQISELRENLRQEQEEFNSYRANYPAQAFQVSQFRAEAFYALVGLIMDKPEFPEILKAMSEKYRIPMIQAIREARDLGLNEAVALVKKTLGENP